MSWTELPSEKSNSGSTNTTPTNPQIAPAVCRMSAPMPRLMSAISAG